MVVRPRGLTAQSRQARLEDDIRICLDRRHGHIMDRHVSHALDDYALHCEDADDRGRRRKRKKRYVRGSGMSFRLVPGAGRQEPSPYASRDPETMAATDGTKRREGLACIAVYSSTNLQLICYKDSCPCPPAHRPHCPRQDRSPTFPTPPRQPHHLFSTSTAYTCLSPPMFDR